jgi:hypothetical protein
MARRPALIQKKQKKVRVTKNEAYIVNLKYLGSEPKLSGQASRSDIIYAINWYNYMSDIKEAREFLEDYLSVQGRNEEIKLLKKVSDNFIPTTAAWLSRLGGRGLILNDDNISFIEKSLKTAMNRIIKEEPSSNKKGEVVSIQDRIKEKTSDLLAEIEEIVDKRNENESFSLYEWLKGKEIPASYVPAIINAYRGWLNELLDAYQGDDKELKEAYSSFTKKQLSFDIMFFNMIIDDAEKYADVTKKTRAPRKPRTISVDKKIKNLSYKKEDKEFKIASIDPEKIIGAQELWTFNVKYKTLTVLRASGRAGLDVKGTSILNYDSDNSFTKKTGRKAEYFIDRVLKSGKIVLRKLMEEEGLGTDSNLAYRVNENTILLKVS